MYPLGTRRARRSRRPLVTAAPCAMIAPGADLRGVALRDGADTAAGSAPNTGHWRATPRDERPAARAPPPSPIAACV